jgi:hypothetical protein
VLALAVAANIAIAPGVRASSTAPTLPVLGNDVTLTAARTGYVRVQITQPLDVQLYLARHRPTFTGSGPVGFALLPDEVGSTASNLVVVRQRVETGEEKLIRSAAGADPVTGDRDAPFLRPGAYRLFLLTRGGGSVQFAAPGQPARKQRLTATHRVAWAFRDEAVPMEQTGYGPAMFAATLDYDGTQPGHVFAWLWLHSDASAFFEGEGCFYTGWDQADRDQPGCLGASGGAGPGDRLGPAVDRRDGVWTGGIFDDAPGRAGVRLTYANAGTVTSGRALMFFLPEA